MATRSRNPISVKFVGLGADERPPATALYRYDPKGGRLEKLASVGDDRLDIDPKQLAGAKIALGPDVENPETLDPATLIRYRGDHVIDDWSKRGILIPADRWGLFLNEVVCVSGRVRKCRPWWWDLVYATRVNVGPALRAGTKLGVQANPPLVATGDMSASNIILPWTCLPLCDGVVEVYERVCCCQFVVWDDLIDRLREVLDDIPVEIDWPVPPIPDPGPWTRLSLRGAGPGVAADVAPARRSASAGGAAPDLSRTTVSERVYRDYQQLLLAPKDQVNAFIDARPYLSAYVCHCTSRKVGEAFVRPGGEFDFCYWRPRRVYALHCHTTYAYRVKQLIGGVWTVVYDGLAAHDYFAAGEEADLKTSHPAARPCGDGPNPPDPGDGTAFVMLEHVTGAGTHHFNFPAQNGVSQVNALGTDSGLYTVNPDAADCPWATTLGLRLWVSPSLEGTVSYYRFKVVPVSPMGQPVGTPEILGSPVAWQRFVSVPGDVIVTSTGLAANPVDVANQEGLFTVPYWSGGMNWLSGQYHQNWDTTRKADGTLRPDGKYLLILELFGPGGARIKPNGAAGPGTDRPFQFRRWEAPGDTDNVPFADCAHVFWIDNTRVVGDIHDLRRNGVANTQECQFISGPGRTVDSVGNVTSEGTMFSAGFTAYHSHGVTTGGGAGDTNSFMQRYTLTWQRGLNGPSGTIETGTADQGELAVEESNALSLAYLLGPHPQPPAAPVHPAHTACTFSIHLHVAAKHHNGASFITGYDYHETASFALQLTP